jgi:hypothetical protein
MALSNDEAAVIVKDALKDARRGSTLASKGVKKASVAANVVTVTLFDPVTMAEVTKTVTVT